MLDLLSATVQQFREVRELLGWLSAAALALCLALVGGPPALQHLDSRRARTKATRASRSRISLAWGLGAVALLLGLPFALSFIPASPPTPAASATSPASTPAAGRCLAYSRGTDLEWQKTYAESDFALVDCSKPHQFEVIARDPDSTCDDAGSAAIHRGSLRFEDRAIFADIGPTGCALGRYLNSTVETDSFRISSSRSPISVFGTCIDPAETSAYLAEGDLLPRMVECERGAVLISGIVLTDEAAEAFCAKLAANIPSTRVDAADVTLKEGDRGVKCALQLKYSDG